MRIPSSDGWPTGRQTQVLRTGDQISINGFLYLVTEDVRANSGQSDAIPVFPAVPASGIADNTRINVTRPVGTWILLENQISDRVGDRTRASIRAIQDVRV